MSYHKEEQDIYYIPPNFLTSGRLFGGMIRVRNAIEACVLVLLTGLPIIRLPLSLTARIILLCLIPLPLGIFAVIGFDGDSLTEFALNWIMPPSPAFAPYAIFMQSSETVRSSVIIGLGSKLQVMQAQQVRDITSYNEIDLELPGKQKCAYFCIVSDQDIRRDVRCL